MQTASDEERGDISDVWDTSTLAEQTDQKFREVSPRWVRVINLSHVHITGAFLSESQYLKADYAVYFKAEHRNWGTDVFHFRGLLRAFL